VRARHLLPFLLVAATVLPAPLAAQARPGLEVQLPTNTRLTVEGPTVKPRNILDDIAMRELLMAGFPARLHFRVELWADGWLFDELQQTVEWDVIIQFRGVEQQYEVIQYVGGRPFALGTFAKIEDADAAASRPLRVPLSAPEENRRFYYLATLEVVSMEASDLDEVGRWLRGELSPAVRGERSAGTALSRGLRAITTRLLGGERREYSQRSPSFRPIAG
jgi:hypothetical protein